MSFSASQPRGPDGKWIPTGTRKVRRSKRSKANKRAYAKPRTAPIKISKAASRQNRGVGLSGLKKNLIPYARVSKKSATIGVNTGTFLPGTNKRIVVGQYARLESVNKSGKVDQAAKSVYGKIAPKGSRRALIGNHIRKNAKLDNPAIRYSTPGTGSREGVQVRLGTSRKAGPTLIVRRGSHKPAIAGSKLAVKRYDQKTRKRAAKRAKTNSRAARRKSANRKKK